MDFGAIIKAPMEDQSWIKKVLLMGLILLIPLIGPLNLLGYLKAIFEERQKGSKELPNAGFGYIGAGFWLLVAFLPLIGLLIAIPIVAGILGNILAHVSSGLAQIVALLFALLSVAVAVALAAIGPAIVYLHVAKGERWASIKLGAIIGLIQEDVGRYVMFWLLFFVAGLIGSAGSVLCGIGALFTMPLGYAIQGVGIHELDKLRSGAGASTKQSPATPA